MCAGMEERGCVCEWTGWGMWWDGWGGWVRAGDAERCAVAIRAPAPLQQADEVVPVKAEVLEL